MTARSAGEAMRTAEISAAGQAACRAHPRRLGTPRTRPGLQAKRLRQVLLALGAVGDEVAREHEGESGDA